MIIPVKGLDSSKSRLSPYLNPTERGDLTLAMLKDIICSALKTERIIEIVVISNDTNVLKIAKKFGVRILKEESQGGLNKAIKNGINFCLEKKADTVLIHPVDIPLVTSEDLIQIINSKETPGVILVPSKGFNGTSVMMLSPPNIIPPKYGKNSLTMHAREALKRKIYPKILNLPNVSMDVDDPQDFLLLNNGRMNEYTRKFFETQKSKQNFTH